MKKLLCLFMATISILTMLAGCTGKQADPTTDPTTAPTEVTQSPEEAAVYKILMIGQSLAQDTVWFLYDVLKAEMPDKEFMVGDVYKSTDLEEHVANIKSNNPVYTYYEWSDKGRNQVSKTYTIDEALKGQQWDLIIFNDATYPTTREREFLDGDHEFMIEHIRKTAAPGYQLAYNATWAKPKTRELHSDDNWSHFVTHFGGDRDLYYSLICYNIKYYIEPNEEFDLVFYTGTALQYATETCGVEEAEVYRDHIHLSDYGRLLVAYQVYAQIFGLEKLTQVNVDKIKLIDRFTNDKHNPTDDLEISEHHRDAIIASVNWALEYPNSKPSQTAR